MSKKIYKCYFTILISLFFLTQNFLVYGAGIKTKVEENAQMSMVLIKSYIYKSPYHFQKGNMRGSGAIVDKKKGIIISSIYTTGSCAAARYDVMFYDGTTVSAKLLYYDEWLGISFLQVNPKFIPDKSTEIVISTKAPYINQPIFLMDNYGTDEFSLQRGIISDIYSISPAMSTHTINLSMNNRVSGSESPVFDQSGGFVGFKYGSGDTYASAIHPKYISHAVSFLKNRQLPPRKHSGVITSLYSLSLGQRNRKYPSTIIDTYTKSFPHSRQKAIQVIQTIHASPASKFLKIGDIIWKVNGKLIGPNLINFDMICNNAKNDVINITVIRDGKEMDFDIQLYDLEKQKIRKFLSFNDFLFFEANDIFSVIFGIKPEGVLGMRIGLNYNNQAWGYNLDINSIQLLRVDNNKITTLDSLIEIIPEIYHKKYMMLKIINFNGFQRIQSFRRNIENIDFACDMNHDSLLYQWNQKKLDWDITDLKLNKATN